MKLSVGLLVGLFCAIALVSANTMETSINEPLFIKTMCDGLDSAAEITIYSGTAVNPDNLVVPRTAMDKLSDKDFEYVATFSQKGQYTAFEFCTYGGGFETTQQTDITVTDPLNLIEPSARANYQYQASLFYDVFFKENPTQKNTVRFDVGNETLTFQPLDFGIVQLKKNGKPKETGISIEPLAVVGYPVGNTFTYQGVYGGGIDLLYLVNKKYVKEEIAVASFSALPVPTKKMAKHEVVVQFNALLKLNGNYLVVDGKKWNMKKDVQTSNIVMVKDKQGNTIYQLQIPVAFDTNGSKVIGSYMLSKSGDGVLVQVNMPYDWFANASRVYPIYIDPTVDTPDGTAEFGTGTPQILVENVTIPAGIPYTITEQIVVDNTTIMDAECECDIINTDTQEKIVDFRSFFNDGFGNMLFTWDEPLLGNYTLSQYCWRGDTLVLNKIYSISIMWVV